MSESTQRPFHLAFPVNDIEATRAFYEELLGARVGRAAERWIDFDFWGHQISAHVVDRRPSEPATNPVDGERVPARHFGVVLLWDEWHRLRDRLVEERVAFLIEPQVRFQGEAGEQATMFFLDPSGNALEFKSFRDEEQLFAT
jgi:extradiol dioxygenase family protein